MIVGRRGERIVSPVSNVSMGEGESKICTALRSRARASRIKKREVQKIKEEGGRGRCLDRREGEHGYKIRQG